jgi:hypothetical protein
VPEGLDDAMADKGRNDQCIEILYTKEDKGMNGRCLDNWTHGR